MISKTDFEHNSQKQIAAAYVIACWHCNLANVALEHCAAAMLLWPTDPLESCPLHRHDLPHNKALQGVVNDMLRLENTSHTICYLLQCTGHVHADIMSCAQVQAAIEARYASSNALPGCSCISGI